MVEIVPAEPILGTLIVCVTVAPHPSVGTEVTLRSVSEVTERVNVTCPVELDLT